jgi:cell wall-associated NlpC family hydrolase
MSFSLAERILAFDAQVTHTALRYLGVPYVWGGTTYSGVDCSGFVQAVFEHNGVSLPRTADSQFEVGRAIRMRDLMPGDLVFFETYTVGPSHVGIYLGGGRFVHASASDGVRVDHLSDDYYAERYLGARRLIH